MAQINGNGKATIGLILLALGSSTAIWSSLNTSPTGIFKFVAKDEDKGTERVARDAMNISLGLIILLALGIWLIYKHKGMVPAIATVGIGIALWFYYNWLLAQGAKIKSGEQSRYNL